MQNTQCQSYHEKIAHPIEYYEILSEHIYWKSGMPYWNKNLGHLKNANCVAGSINNKTKYRKIGITIDGVLKQISAARLHWYMVYGCLPTMIDHINRNRLDDRIENLREVNTSQNTRNRKNYSSHSYKGVTFYKSRNKWRARIHINKSIHLGYFSTEIEAAKAYDNALIEYKLTEHAVFNFPKERIN